jgi:hypothetical protein
MSTEIEEFPMPAIRTIVAITGMAGALAAASPAFADTPVDPGTPPAAQDEGAPLPGGDPLPADPNWVDDTKIPYDEGAPLPGGDPEPADPKWTDDTKVPYDEGAPLPGGDPQPADPKATDDAPPAHEDGDPLPGGDPTPGAAPVRTTATALVRDGKVVAVTKKEATRHHRHHGHHRHHRVR